MIAWRTAIAEDAPQLAVIDRAATAYPWTASQFESACTGTAGRHVEIGRDGQGPAALLVTSLVVDELTILNIAVHPRVRRRGIAGSALQRACEVAVLAGAVRCLLEVRASNQPAIALYAALGFVEDGRRRAYYPTADGREDAVLMSLLLKEP